MGGVQGSIHQRLATHPASPVRCWRGLQGVTDFVVYDRVLGRDAPRRLRLQNQRQKYLLTDHTMQLAYD